MRFRLGLFLGFLTGYILGSKAGRERYEQIMQLWGSFSSSEPAQQLGAEVRDVAHRAGEVLEKKASEGVGKVSGLVGSGDKANDDPGQDPLGQDPLVQDPLGQDTIGRIPPA